MTLPFISYGGSSLLALALGMGIVLALTPQALRRGGRAMSAARLIVLAAGGTGGHVFPAEALAERCCARGYRLALVTDRRGAASAASSARSRRIACRWRACRAASSRACAASCRSALGVFQARRAAAPAEPRRRGRLRRLSLAADRLSPPRARHPDGAARAERRARPRQPPAGAAASRRSRPSFPRSQFLPRRAAQARQRHRQSGPPRHPRAPRRPYAAARRRRAVPHPRHRRQPGRPHLQRGRARGARAPAAARCATRLAIAQQARAEDLEARARRLRGARHRAPSCSRSSATCRSVSRAAHLVICRSGASTVAELATVGRPAILVPYPHATDDHQTANAQALADAGGGWVVPQRGVQRHGRSPTA